MPCMFAVFPSVLCSTAIVSSAVRLYVYAAGLDLNGGCLHLNASRRTAPGTSTAAHLGYWRLSDALSDAEERAGHCSYDVHHWLLEERQHAHHGCVRGEAADRYRKVRSLQV